MTTIALRKPHRDRSIQGIAAKWYAVNTAEMMQQYVGLAARMAGQLPQGSDVLEIAPGPGYFCVELAKLGRYAITGIDISHSMVQIATKNAERAGVPARFLQGSASKLPFHANSFDFLLCRAAFKNFAQPVEALQEMCRVLRPAGRAVLIDLNRNASPEDVSRGIDEMQLSRLNHLFTKLVFKASLIKNAYARGEFEHMLAQTEFGCIDIREESMGFEIWMTK